MQINGLDPINTPRANTAMRTAFWTRTKSWIWPKLCGSYTSDREVEPHGFTGSVPGLTEFAQGLAEVETPQFGFQIPNLLFKNLVPVRRRELEFDQTRSVVSKAAQVGNRIAEFPEHLFAARLLTADNPLSATVKYEGQTYQQTFDGQPLFSKTHDTIGGGTQSNVIKGSLPKTIALLNAQSWADSAEQMQADISAVIATAQGIRDTSNMPLFPGLDMGENLVVVVPPCLRAIAALAFKTGPNSVINQTTNIAPMFVKDVISTGFLGGSIPSPLTAFNGTISAANQTDYYVFVTHDQVKPFYHQMYRPLRKEDEAPPEGGGNADVAGINGGIIPEAAAMFASSILETTFSNQGASATEDTITKERYLISARWRGNMAYGIWFTAYVVKPVDGLLYVDGPDAF